eukprot:11216203-Lingulodinium_polyedra.AAC.1
MSFKTNNSTLPFSSSNAGSSLNAKTGADNPKLAPGLALFPPKKTPPPPSMAALPAQVAGNFAV